jgi:hypothetical protein
VWCGLGWGSKTARAYGFLPAGGVGSPSVRSLPCCCVCTCPRMLSLSIYLSFWCRRRALKVGSLLLGGAGGAFCPCPIVIGPFRRGVSIRLPDRARATAAERTGREETMERVRLYPSPTTRSLAHAGRMEARCQNSSTDPPTATAPHDHASSTPLQTHPQTNQIAHPPIPAEPNNDHNIDKTGAAVGGGGAHALHEISGGLPLPAHTHRNGGAWVRLGACGGCMYISALIEMEVCVAVVSCGVV